MKLCTALLIVFVIILPSSKAYAELELFLPADRQVHELILENPGEPVVIYVTDDVFLDGALLTGYNVTFKAAEDALKPPKITFNPTFNFSGYTGSPPYYVTFDGVGDVIFNTPVQLQSHFRVINAQNSRIEINRNFEARAFSSYISTLGESSEHSGVFIKGGAVVNLTSWYADLDQGSFYLSGGAQLNVISTISLYAGHKVVWEGEVSTGIVIIHGGYTADIQLHRVKATNYPPGPGSFAFAAVFVSGKTISFYQDVIATAWRFNVSAEEIYLYGVTLQAGDFGGRINFAPFLDQSSSRLYSYGATLVADGVGIYSELNDFGLEIVADDIDIDPSRAPYRTVTR